MPGRNLPTPKPVLEVGQQWPFTSIRNISGKIKISLDFRSCVIRLDFKTKKEIQILSEIVDS